jgi:hypothetical protein
MTGDRRARTRRDKRGEGNMRGIRRVTTTAGFLVLALLPVAAAVSPDRVPAGPVPVAIAQPLTMPLLSERSSPILSESGLLVLVGSGLMGLAAFVRRTTKV